MDDIYGRVIAYVGSRHHEQGHDLIGNYRIVYWGDEVEVEQRYTIERYLPKKGGITEEPPVSARWEQLGHAEDQPNARMVLKMVIDRDAAFEVG